MRGTAADGGRRKGRGKSKESSGEVEGQNEVWSKRLRNRRKDRSSPPRSQATTSGTTRPSKRARTSGQGSKKPARATRGHGKLAVFGDIPLDIFHEILSNLLPADLLNAARTTRPWRDFLMSRKSSFVWARARENVPYELPPCPEDLSEPQYAKLIWGKDCDVCGKTNCKCVDFSLRARTCKECTLRHVGSHWTDPDILAMVPFTIRGPSGRRDPNYIWHFTPDVEVARDELRGFYEEGHTAKERLAFLKRKEKQVIAIVQHAEELYKWEARSQSVRRDKSAIILARREQSIVDELDKLGYGESTYREKGFFRAHQFVKSPAALTPKAWQLKKEAFLEDLNRDIVETREFELEALKRSRAAALVSLYQSWNEEQEDPAANFVYEGLLHVLPTIVATSRPDGPPIDNACLTEILPQVFKDISDFRITAMKGMLKLAKSSQAPLRESASTASMSADVANDATEDSLAKLLDNVNALYLCLTPFRCRAEFSLVRWSEVWKHPCFFGFARFGQALCLKLEEAGGDFVKQLAAKMPKQGSLSKKQVSALLKGAVSEWPRLGNRFVCPQCPKRKPMDLAKLITHNRVSHSSSPIDTSAAVL